MILVRESFSFRTLPVPMIPGIECVGLVWDTVESLAICLVYRPPNAPADVLPNLLKRVAEWAGRFPKLLVLGDFNEIKPAIRKVWT